MKKFEELRCLACKEVLTVKDMVNPATSKKLPEICLKCKNKRYEKYI